MKHNKLSLAIMRSLLFLTTLTLAHKRTFVVATSLLLLAGCEGTGTEFKASAWSTQAIAHCDGNEHTIHSTGTQAERIVVEVTCKCEEEPTVTWMDPQLIPQQDWHPNNNELPETKTLDLQDSSSVKIKCPKRGEVVIQAQCKWMWRSA